MNTLLNGMKKATNYALTENGAIKHNRSQVRILLECKGIYLGP